MSVEATRAFQLKRMGVNVEKLSALSTICLFCAYFWNSFVWVGRDTCSTIFLNLLCYWHFDEVIFFLHCPLKNGMVFSAISRICMFLFEDCALFFSWIYKKKYLLVLWVNFSLVLGILLVMLHLGEFNQESKLLRSQVAGIQFVLDLDNSI